MYSFRSEHISVPLCDSVFWPYLHPALFPSCWTVPAALLTIRWKHWVCFCFFLFKRTFPPCCRRALLIWFFSVILCLCLCSHWTLSQCVNFTSLESLWGSTLRIGVTVITDKESWALTQGDLLSGVGGQQEDEEGEGGDEDTGDEEVEPVVERPPPHHHGEGHVRVRLLTAVVETLVPPPRNLCAQTGKHRRWRQRNHKPRSSEGKMIFCPSNINISQHVFEFKPMTKIFNWKW